MIHRLLALFISYPLIPMLLRPLNLSNFLKPERNCPIVFFFNLLIYFHTVKKQDKKVLKAGSHWFIFALFTNLSIYPNAVTTRDKHSTPSSRHLRTHRQRLLSCKERGRLLKTSSLVNNWRSWKTWRRSLGLKLEFGPFGNG